MAEWKEYAGSDEQIEEMANGFIFRDHNNEECNLIYRLDQFMDSDQMKKLLNACGAKSYLICEPHPYADMIKRWADTGQPVWVKINDYTKTRYMTTKPDWNIPNADYSFKPFK